MTVKELDSAAQEFKEHQQLEELLAKSALTPQELAYICRLSPWPDFANARFLVPALATLFVAFGVAVFAKKFVKQPD